MKPNGWLLLFGAMFFIAVCEITFHWLLGRGAFPAFLSFYLYVDPQSGKATFAGDVMKNAPSAFLGCVNGWVGYHRWSAITLCVNAFVLALFVALMISTYGMFIGQRQFATARGPFVFNTFTALLVTGFFTLGAYIFRREWKRRRGLVR